MRFEAGMDMRGGARALLGATAAARERFGIE
jgi:hypothetical protein